MKRLRSRTITWISIVLLLTVVLPVVSCTKVTSDAILARDVTVIDKRGLGRLPLSYWITPRDENIISVVKSVASSTYTTKEIQIYAFVTSFSHQDDGVDFWQTPSETLKVQSGNCVDLSLLVASLFVTASLSDVYIVIGTQDGLGHMWVEYGSRLYEPTKFIIPFSIEKRAEFSYNVKYRILVGGN